MDYVYVYITVLGCCSSPHGQIFNANKFWNITRLPWIPPPPQRLPCIEGWAILLLALKPEAVSHEGNSKEGPWPCPIDFYGHFYDVVVSLPRLQLSSSGFQYIIGCVGNPYFKPSFATKNWEGGGQPQSHFEVPKISKARSDPNPPL